MDICSFERPRHRCIAAVLQALDAELLRRHACLFGGGTAITLCHGEFRESVDIDFLVSDRTGYRALRQLLTGPKGVQALARHGQSLNAVREVRADQYGIRTLLQAEQMEIKFEIVLEARIPLDVPGDADLVCGVSTLTALDMAASKLLANSDRWADDGVFSRDLIDLAMLQPGRTLLAQAIAKAAVAYGSSVEADLVKAIAHLRDRPGRIERCMQMLRMALPKALLWQRISALRPRPARVKPAARP